VTGNKADAAEVMQDAFVKLWERWESIERIGDPTAYLSGCVVTSTRPVNVSV
jgi:DNA-directed RNA polymerase specialized sigma24 family protein